MKKEDFLAKSNGESIKEHTQALLMLFEDFCSIFNDKIDEKTKLMIRLASQYHDLGKMNASFQSYIYQKSNLLPPKCKERLWVYNNIVGKDIPHGILSAAFISRKKLEEQGLELEDIKVIVTAVANHHIRSLKNEDSEETLKKVIQQDLAIAAQNYGLDYCKSVPLVHYNFFSPKKCVDISQQLWLKYAFVKGMLNKLDYGASAYAKEIEISPVDAKDMSILAMGKKGFELRECQEYVKDKGEQNIIMSASTGMGKTEAAMIWASGAKTFYTLPYKVSINAIHKRICEERYYEPKKCVLLHSDTFSKLLDAAEKSDGESGNNDIFKEYESIKSLSYPFTVCTVDQLFLFPYLAHGTELVLATLSYSKIIIDEIQAYNPKILAKILYGLVMINKMGGKFLIMTATLPPFIKDYLSDNIPSLTISPTFYTPDTRHIPTVVKGEMDFDAIAKEGQNRKVLVICNTVAKACNAYLQLKDLSAHVNLLHSRFIQRDRLLKEEEIKSFADSTESGIWVSTQLVEASLDIDFDMLFTEMSTADSILQRMGRCYRKRIYKENQPNVVIYDNESGTGYGKKSIYDYEIYSRSVDELQVYCNQPFSEEEKQKYIESVYDTESIKNTYYYKEFKKEIDFLEYGVLAGEFTADDARKKFREIENKKAIPFKFLDEVKDIENRISYLSRTNRKSEGENSDKTVRLEKKKLNEKLNSLSLQVNIYNKKKYGIHKDNTLNDTYITILTNEYDYEVGLKDLSEKGCAL